MAKICCNRLNKLSPFLLPDMLRNKAKPKQILNLVSYITLCSKSGVLNNSSDVTSGLKNNKLRIMTGVLTPANEVQLKYRPILI
uniref:Uncharacterized protein n=1 Tax=Strigamia maritima TaxID=126957 RepID=T1JMN8_STRMM